MGELRKFYSLADVVFVGRSLVPMGGSDPMEVAALGRPIIIGPHTDNFQLPVEALRKGGAIRILQDAEGLASAVRAILGDPGEAAALGARAREVLIRNQGATERTAAGVVRLLEVAESGADR
jgi:3-deoxy-D-manno-octulosonic-acid transferase